MARIRKPRPWTLDFETGAIQQRPFYPPIPVGFSIKKYGQKKSVYYAFGHPTDNNCTKEDAINVLRKFWESGEPVLCHNGKFDIDVATEHMGMSMLPWNLIHDTMFLLFLDDPHAKDLKLKPAAERYLGMKPEEQDAVFTWLKAHQQVLRDAGYIGPKEQITKVNFGAYISLAPGTLVGEYANGDVIRTEKLFDLLWPSIEERGMLAAYDRDRELMPILLQNEREGMRVDLPLLRQDVAIYEEALKTCDAWIRKRLNAKDLNIDSNDDLADALQKAGVVTEWVMTAPSKNHPNGQRSTSKKNMTPSMFADARVASALGYHSRLSTCLGTFMRPWLETAEASKGVIYTNWSQVRQTKNRKENKGARTGRISSSPNFMNIPKDLEDKDDDYVHPKHIKALPPLPLLRKYILPDKGCKWGHRDYNQQELRILAHFEDAGLLELYNDPNPPKEYLKDGRVDVHNFVTIEIKNKLGLELNRSSVKQINFGKIYGMGLGAYAEKLKTTVDEVKKIKAAQESVIPGLKALEKNIKARAKSDQPIITWGGRQYFTEPPVIINGHAQTFEYKLLNYLIQGSAADCTKQALINYAKVRKHGRFVVTVHDEINISCPAKFMKEEMEILRQAMLDVAFDVPMLSDGKVGLRWSELKKFKEAM
jgi:DNA polymerase I-like protein with 3'-5' exonuclease and polymerase domains